MIKTPSKVIVILPAYNAEKTLKATIEALPPIYDEILLCDDASGDGTYKLAKHLGITSIRHSENRGYGGNQKTLFKEALKKGAGIVVMVHPDNQYDTICLPKMIELLNKDPIVGLVIGSRMASALEKGMPIWKYISNHFLTFFQNLVFQTRLSEFHSGLRVYNARILSKMPFEKFSEGFVFDSETIAWLVANDFKINEVGTNCYYTQESSSLGMSGSIRYGLLTLFTLVMYLFGHYEKNTDQ